MLKIRKGKFSDVNEIFSIINKTPDLQAEPVTKKSIKAAIKDKKGNLVLIAEEGKEFAGFLMAEMPSNGNYSYLAGMYIKPKFRGRGISTELMNNYEKICGQKNLNSITAAVHATNKKMQKIVGKKGYKKKFSFYFYIKELRC
jgi:ribosomal protein S18 acetylase RimI-like enzyme